MACGLLLFLLAAAVAFAAAGGCLVTDPVPYEPAENIPPILVWQPRAPGDPFNPMASLNAVEIEEATLSFSVPVIEYNLDDSVDFRYFVDITSTNHGLTGEGRVPPSGGRERNVAFSLSTTTAPLVSGNCHKVTLVISDRNWAPGGPPFYGVPTGDDGEPVTVPAFVQWWVWRDDGDPTTPHLADCDSVVFPE